MEIDSAMIQVLTNGTSANISALSHERSSARALERSCARALERSSGRDYGQLQGFKGCRNYGQHQGFRQEGQKLCRALERQGKRQGQKRTDEQRHGQGPRQVPQKECRNYSSGPKVSFQNQQNFDEIVDEFVVEPKSNYYDTPLSKVIVRSLSAAIRSLAS